MSLARSSEGTLASGHVDGTLYVSGRLLLRYALPPTALALLPPHASLFVLLFEPIISRYLSCIFFITRDQLFNAA